MDLAFFRRGFQGRASARLDYGLLVASLKGLQAASPAARAEAQGPAPAETISLPLVDLLLGAPGWRDAAARQHGSFNPDQAGRLSAVTQMTGPFTFAF